MKSMRTISLILLLVFSIAENLLGAENISENEGKRNCYPIYHKICRPKIIVGIGMISLLGGTVGSILFVDLRKEVRSGNVEIAITIGVLAGIIFVYLLNKVRKSC
jgi:uncharacterized membrane protein